MAQPATIESNSQPIYSLEEFEKLELPNDDNKYELIDGVLKVAPPPGFQHGKIAANIVWQIILFDPNRNLGLVLQDSGFKVAPGFAPAPDVAFIMAANIPPTTVRAVPVAPDLAVEVWSPGDLDTAAHRAEARAKIRHYQVAGVALVWAINPPARTVEVYHPNQTGPVQVLGIEDDLSGEQVIPGFIMPVKALFE
jgi:Uma2 family endonuclease